MLFLIKYEVDNVRETKSISKSKPLETQFEKLHFGSKVMAKYKEVGYYATTGEEVILKAVIHIYNVCIGIYIFFWL